MSEIPDRPHPVFHQHIGHFDGLLLGDGQHRDIHLIPLDKAFKLVHHTNGNAPDRHSLQPWVHIEDPFQDEAPLLERRVISQRLSQITGSDDDDIMVFFQT